MDDSMRYPSSRALCTEWNGFGLQVLPGIGPVEDNRVPHTEQKERRFEVEASVCGQLAIASSAAMGRQRFAAVSLCLQAGELGLETSGLPIRALNLKLET
jgi:hypothetical protein